MPRFYFDIREGPRFTPDDEGLEFASLDGAEREATKAVAEIGRDRLPSGEARDIGIEVRNEHHRFVLAVMLSMRIRRADPPPVTSFGLVTFGVFTCQGQRPRPKPDTQSQRLIPPRL
jgi:hypothetical protein